jgi:hypothetical protein
MTLVRGGDKPGSNINLVRRPKTFSIIPCINNCWTHKCLAWILLTNELVVLQRVSPRESRYGNMGAAAGAAAAARARQFGMGGKAVEQRAAAYITELQYSKSSKTTCWGTRVKRRVKMTISKESKRVWIRTRFKY